MHRCNWLPYKTRTKSVIVFGSLAFYMHIYIRECMHVCMHSRMQCSTNYQVSSMSEKQNLNLGTHRQHWMQQKLPGVLEATRALQHRNVEMHICSSYMYMHRPASRTACSAAPLHIGEALPDVNLGLRDWEVRGSSSIAWLTSYKPFATNQMLALVRPESQEILIFIFTWTSSSSLQKLRRISRNPLYLLELIFCAL